MFNCFPGVTTNILRWLNTKSGDPPSVSASVYQSLGRLVSAVKFSCVTVKKAVTALFAPKQNKPSHIDSEQKADIVKGTHRIGILKVVQRELTRLFNGNSGKNSSSAPLKPDVVKQMYEQISGVAEMKRCTDLVRKRVCSPEDMKKELSDKQKVLGETLEGILANNINSVEGPEACRKQQIKAFLDVLIAPESSPVDVVIELQHSTNSPLTAQMLNTIFYSVCRIRVINQVLKEGQSGQKNCVTHSNNLCEQSHNSLI